MFTSKLGLSGSGGMGKTQNETKEKDPTILHIPSKIDLETSPSLDADDNIVYRFRVIGFSEGVACHPVESIQYGGHDMSAEMNLQPSLKTFISSDDTMVSTFDNIYKGSEKHLRDAKTDYNNWLIALMNNGTIAKPVKDKDYINTKSKILTSLYIENDPINPENNGTIKKFFMPQSVWNDVFINKGKRGIEAIDHPDLIRKVRDMEYKMKTWRKNKLPDPMKDKDFRKDFYITNRQYNDIEKDVLDLNYGVVLNYTISPRASASDMYKQSSVSLNEVPSMEVVKYINENKLSFAKTIGDLFEHYTKGTSNVESLQDVLAKGVYTEMGALYEISIQRLAKSIEIRLGGSHSCELFNQWRTNEAPEIYKQRADQYVAKNDVVASTPVSVGYSTPSNVTVTVDTPVVGSAPKGTALQPVNRAEVVIPTAEETLAKISTSQESPSSHVDDDDEIPF